MDKQIEKGLSARKAANELFQQYEEELEELRYSPNALRQRYLYVKGKKDPVQSEPPKKNKLKKIPSSKAKSEETVTIGIRKSIADDFLALAKKGTWGSGWKGMDLNSLTEKFIFNKVQSGKNRLKKMNEKQYVRDQIAGIDRVKKEMEEQEQAQI